MTHLTVRADGRQAADLRPLSYELDYAPHAEGSVLIRSGNTRVLCAATVEENVPAWLLEQGKGWITAEYSMLPRATTTRTRRDKCLAAGRTHDIQRLIGRSLRAVADLKALGQRRIILDCDVIHADAGTRTASITGSWIALAIACDRLVRLGKIPRWPLRDKVAAISLGLLGDEIRLDLDFSEDVEAAVDLNLVMTASGNVVEVQGTGEEATFSRSQLNDMVELGWTGLQPLFQLQADALKQKGIER
jgi:ribonuclease PH